MARVSVFVIVVALTCIAAQKLRGNVGKPARSSCKGSFCDGVPDDRFAVLVEKGSISVSIGYGDLPGKSHEKCIDVASPVSCEKDAGNLGKRLNDDDHTDIFEITVSGGGTKVCARRTDKEEGWGQFLKISCKEEAGPNNEKCMCLTSPEGDCSCKGCTETEQQHTCTELLGPCACQRSEEAICDCSGYCHTSDHRKNACEDEAGCMWTGRWCEAQIGLLWD